MKSAIGLVLAFFSLNVFSYYSQFDGVPEEICPELKEGKYDIAFCKADNSKAVLAAKTGNKLTDVDSRNKNFYFHDVVELGIMPDADTSTVYFFSFWLLDGNGKKVGYKTVNGYTNSEMEVSGRVDVRYNLKGEAVSIELLPIRR